MPLFRPQTSGWRKTNSSSRCRMIYACSSEALSYHAKAHLCHQAEDSLLCWQPSAAEEILEAGIGPKRIPNRIVFEIENAPVPLLVGFFEPVERVVLVTQACVSKCKRNGRERNALYVR